MEIKRLTKKPSRKKTKRQRDSERKRHLKEWCDFLKNDVHWDYGSILKLILFKLRRTRETIVSNKIIADMKSVAMEIKEVETLLGRATEDKYYEKLLLEFEKKHGKQRMTFPVVKKENGVTTTRIDFLYGGRPATKAMMCKMRKIFRLAEQQRLNDLRKGFALMAENIQGWWD